ncbi:hypothetical protein [Streptomyces sp. NPDC085932]|uniref:hypothetical protein n=1 Tax=Streptomyces sp. NPDC085932 TaxID=3365741 RepID=UPI0037D88AC6
MASPEMSTHSSGMAIDNQYVGSHAVAQEMEAVSLPSVAVSAANIARIQATIGGQVIEFTDVARMDYRNTLGLSGRGGSEYARMWWLQQKKYPFIRKEVKLVFFDSAGRSVLSYGLANSRLVGYERVETLGVTQERIVLQYENLVDSSQSAMDG